MVKIPAVNFKKILPFIVILLVLVIVGGGVYYFNYAKKTTNSEVELNMIVSKVGKLIELPIGEKPTLATVSDPAQLASQPFFSKAQIGDKVLIYVQAKKAILYRPSTNKIINVGPINITSPVPTESAGPGGVNQASEEAKPLQQPVKTNVKIALFNGTTTSGLTNRFASDISKKITDVQFSIVAKENANKQNYEKTQIIDVTGTNQSVVRSLALTFKAVSGKLPDGETAPEGAEVLVIIGADYAGGSIKPTSVPTPTPESVQ